MKKAFYGVMAMFVMLVASSCSSNGLEGTWVAEDFLGDKMMLGDLGKQELILEFDDDEVEVSVDVSGTSGQENMSMDLGLSMEVTGKYKVNEDKLTMDFSKSKPKMDIYKFKINADEKTTKILEAMGMGEKTMKEQVEKQMEEQDFVGNLGIGQGELTIKTLEEDKLVLISDGQELKFKRK